jgi:hypothetical protein
MYSMSVTLDTSQDDRSALKEELSPYQAMKALFILVILDTSHDEILPLKRGVLWNIDDMVVVPRMSGASVAITLSLRQP